MKKTSRIISLLLIIVGIGVFLGGAAFGAMQLIKKSSEDQFFNTAEKVVATCEDLKKESNGSSSCQVSVVYSYGSGVYTATLDQVDGTKLDRGTTFYLYVNPADPEDCRLPYQDSYFTTNLIFFGSIAAGGLILLIVGIAVLKKAKSMAAPVTRPTAFLDTPAPSGGRASSLSGNGSGMAADQRFRSEPAYRNSMPSPAPMTNNQTPAPFMPAPMTNDQAPAPFTPAAMTSETLQDPAMFAEQEMATPEIPFEPSMPTEPEMATHEIPFEPAMPAEPEMTMPEVPFEPAMSEQTGGGNWAEEIFGDSDETDPVPQVSKEPAAEVLPETEDSRFTGFVDLDDDM